MAWSSFSLPAEFFICEMFWARFIKGACILFWFVVFGKKTHDFFFEITNRLFCRLRSKAIWRVKKFMSGVSLIMICFLPSPFFQVNNLYQSLRGVQVQEIYVQVLIFCFFAFYFVVYFDLLLLRDFFFALEADIGFIFKYL